MTIDHSVTNTEQLERQNPAVKTKIKLKKLKDQALQAESDLSRREWQLKKAQRSWQQHEMKTR